jgi:hypothetical protein
MLQDKASCFNDLREFVGLEGISVEGLQGDLKLPSTAIRSEISCSSVLLVVTGILIIALAREVVIFTVTHPIIPMPNPVSTRLLFTFTALLSDFQINTALDSNPFRISNRFAIEHS